MQNHHLLRILLFIAITSNTILLPAQKLNYKDYRFPEVKYKALQLYEEFDLRNNLSQTNRPTRFNNNFSLSQDIYENRGNFQHSAYRNLASNISLHPTNNIYNNSINGEDKFRKYNAKNNFFEYGYQANLSHNQRTKINVTNSLNFRARVPLKIGKGRIDVLNEVMRGEYILDDLKQSGIISDSIGQEVIFRFAQEIAKFQYTRILDSRNYRLQVIKNLSFFLKNNFQVKKDSDIELATILMDNYLSAITGFRTNGSRLSFGISPEVYHSKTFNNIDNSTVYYGGDVMAEYTIQRPISRFLQSNFYTLANFGLSKSNFYLYGIPLSEEIVLNPNVIVGHRLGYFPNSRTSINLTALVDWNYYQNLPIFDTSIKYKSYTVNPKLFLDAAYFVNYRIRLFAVGEVGYFKTFSFDGFTSTQNVDDFIPSPFFNLSDWYIGRTNDLFVNSRNNINFLDNKVSYLFRGGITFSIY